MPRALVLMHANSPRGIASSAIQFGTAQIVDQPTASALNTPMQGPVLLGFVRSDMRDGVPDYLSLGRYHELTKSPLQTSTGTPCRRQRSLQ